MVPDGKFEDRASQFVSDRRLPIQKFNKSQRGGAWTITTDRIEIRYKPGDRRLDRTNLAIVAKTGLANAPVELSPPL